MSVSRVTAVWLLLTVLVVTFSPIATAQHTACPTVTTSDEPGWFHARSFWNPKPAGTLHVNVTVPESDTDCNGLPKELTVPNQQLVTVVVAYPVGYKCTSSLTYAPLSNTSGLPDLIAAFAKVGVLPFALAAPPNPSSTVIPPASSEVMTDVVKCQDSDKTRTLVQNVQVTYRTPTRLTASVGLVVARGVASYGVKTMVTGTSHGVITTQNIVAVTSLPSAQVVPFTFANIYLVGSSSKQIDAQLGFGVNPNLSTPRVEFFASPFAVSWHDIYLSPGVHIGEHEQLTNGFAVGNVLPNGVSKTPINWKFYGSFGFSLSYNLHPLVKGK